MGGRAASSCGTDVRRKHMMDDVATAFYETQFKLEFLQRTGDEFQDFF